MGKQYFRTIKSQGPKEDVVVREHQERLDNYQKFKYPASNAEMGTVKMAVPEVGYNVEIHHASTAMAVKNHDLIIVTVLCCEDEEPGEKN